MESYSVMRQLLKDRHSLADYFAGVMPAFNDVKLRLFLLEREENKLLPDQYYKSSEERCFKGIRLMSQLLSERLGDFSIQYLEWRENKIYVKQQKMNEWQNVMTYLPPLILIAAFIHKTRPISYIKYDEYLNAFIAQNVKYTAILHPYIKEIDEMLDCNEGLNDLHIHLNGSTETDVLWHDCLKNYQKISTYFTENLRKLNLVREQWEQEISWNRNMNLSDLFLLARNLRIFMFKWLYDKKSPCFHNLQFIDLKTNKEGENNSYNPFANLVPYCKNDLAVECLMYVLVLDEIDKNKHEFLSGMLHCYLLILGLVHRLVAQQYHQNGFTQFQKITQNNLRSNIEQFYYKRFLQLNGNEQNYIKFIEGRFAPQKELLSNLNLVGTIVKDWTKYCNNDKSELRLVAHFIKRKEEDKDKNIRFYSLRKQYMLQAKTLHHFIESYPQYCKYVVGVDAAANELDTPPEVFAPAFRYLRKHGMNHFTYHAGEDFNHLLGGMRAIFEAVEYLDLQNYDRIGHACAAGLSPERWLNTVGKTICMRKGEYMDDLLFSYFLISCKYDNELIGKAEMLRSKIEDLAYEIYGNYYPIVKLIHSWKIRCNDPLEKIDDNLYRLYHCDNIKDNYNELVEIETDKFFNAMEYEMLQLLLLRYLHDKGIILEALPTSNIRIGYYTNYDSYHLWQWLKWSEEGKPIPPIVLGTDDTGIFVTNIYNEYANLYCNLVYHQRYNQVKAIEMLKTLNSNGKRYKFQ